MTSNSPITGRHGILRFALLVLLSATAAPYAAAQSTTGNGTPDPYQYANFSPSMAIIIVVLISALFLMGFFSIYIRHCSETRNGASVRAVVAGQQGVGRSRRANRGIDPELLETFPTFAYSTVKGLKIGKGALECAVCLNEFEDDETLRLLPKCDHVFHPECIDAWLSTHTTCPVCRANLALVDGETPVAGEVNVPTSTTAADFEHDSDESAHGSNANELQNSVSIRVVDNQNGDDQLQQVPGPVGLNPSRSVNQNRPPRSRSVKSLFFSKFPRSHSTGHSLVQPGENVDRFTLRLPEDIRKQIMSRALNRTTSLLVLPRETSTRRGYRTGEGSSRGKSYRRLESLDHVGKSDRWVFSMAPPFFVRAPSVRSPKGMANDGEGTSSMPPRGFINSLKKSFGRLNSKGSEPGLASADSARPPV